MMDAEERKQFILDIAEVVHIRAEDHSRLSEDEKRWVRLAIKKEAQSIDLRQAIITKTMTSLVWAIIVGAGYLIIDFFKNHGFK